MIQRRIADELRIFGVPGILAFHVPNGGARNSTEAAILKSHGVVAGIPDFLISVPGANYALELKTDKGRLRPNQRAALETLEANGWTTAVTYGLQPALDQIQAWGLVKESPTYGAVS